jgi:AcrR family transcriptional regulator
MEKDTKTGCKILDAARRVFVAKGFNGCSSREIANEAGMNVALVNYHFKSKENLFDIVVSSVLQEFSLSIFEVFKSF